MRAASRLAAASALRALIGSGCGQGDMVYPMVLDEKCISRNAGSKTIWLRATRGEGQFALKIG